MKTLINLLSLRKGITGILIIMMRQSYSHLIFIMGNLRPRRWWFDTEMPPTWWSHQMETFSTLLAICAFEFTGDRWIPHTKASNAGFGVLFDLRLNKQLSKQSWGWWFETPSRPLWCHCNGVTTKWPSYYWNFEWFKFDWNAFIHNFSHISHPITVFLNVQKFAVIESVVVNPLQRYVNKILNSYEISPLRW